MKILILNYEFPPLGGGAGHVTHEIAKGYVRKGNKVDIITMGYKGLPAYENIDGINIYRVKSIRKKKETCETHEMVSYVISAIHFLNKISRDEKYDVCHCHFLIPTGIVAYYLKKKFSLEYIVTIHGSDVPTYNPDRFKFEHLFTKPILKLVCQNAKMICSPSLYLKELLESHIECRKIMHIPNGIDLDYFKVDFSQPKENIILSTGRLVQRKGFHTLINAVKYIKLPYEVHIAGDGPYRNHLENLSEGSRTKIVFRGWLDKGSKELMDLYAKATIFVLVSSNENASIALLEAMAARCAIISTNVSGCPETVGDAGFLIDYEDDLALRNILLSLAEDQHKIKYFAQKAYLRLIHRFLWPKIIDEYLDQLYK